MEAAFPGDPLLQALSAVHTYSPQGRLTAHEWLSHIERISALCRWTEDTTLQVARIQCQGVASQWLDSTTVTSWADFRAQFTHRFGESLENLLTSFEQCTQRRGEPARTYRDRFLALAARAGCATDSALTSRFFRGLTRPMRKRLAPCKLNLHTIEQIVTAAQSVEDWDAPGTLDDDGPQQEPPLPTPINREQDPTPRAA